MLSFVVILCGVFHNFTKQNMCRIIFASVNKQCATGDIPFPLYLNGNELFYYVMYFIVNFFWHFCKLLPIFCITVDGLSAFKRLAQKVITYISSYVILQRNPILLVRSIIPMLLYYYEIQWVTCISSLTKEADSSAIESIN